MTRCQYFPTRRKGIISFPCQWRALKGAALLLKNYMILGLREMADDENYAQNILI